MRGGRHGAFKRIVVVLVGVQLDLNGRRIPIDRNRRRCFRSPLSANRGRNVAKAKRHNNGKSGAQNAAYRAISTFYHNHTHQSSKAWILCNYPRNTEGISSFTTKYPPDLLSSSKVQNVTPLDSFGKEESPPEGDMDKLCSIEINQAQSRSCFMAQEAPSKIPSRKSA